MRTAQATVYNNGGESPPCLPGGRSVVWRIPYIHKKVIKGCKTAAICRELGNYCNTTNYANTSGTCSFCSLAVLHLVNLAEIQRLPFFDSVQSKRKRASSCCYLTKTKRGKRNKKESSLNGLLSRPIKLFVSARAICGRPTTTAITRRKNEDIKRRN